MMKKLFFVLTLAAMVVGCGSAPGAEAEWDLTLDFEEITLDPGSNTLQLELSQTPKEVAKSKGLDPENISKIELTSAEIELGNDANLDDILTVTLQLAADDADMKTLAVADNEGKGNKNMKLAVAEDVDVTAHFKTGKPIAVLEVSNEEGGQPMKFKAKLKFKIISKKL